jgi:hypothetical protein
MGPRRVIEVNEISDQLFRETAFSVTFKASPEMLHFHVLLRSIGSCSPMGHGVLLENTWKSEAREFAAIVTSEDARSSQHFESLSENRSRRVGSLVIYQVIVHDETGGVIEEYYNVNR